MLHLLLLALLSGAAAAEEAAAELPAEEPPTAVEEPLDEPSRGNQIVFAGPAVTWMSDLGPRFGGVDGFLSAYVSPRVALRFGGGTMSAFGLTRLQKVVSSRRALELGAELYLGNRPWRSPHLGIGLKGQYATGWTQEGASELQLSGAVIPRVGWRFKLGGGALLAMSAGLTVRPATFRVRGSDDDTLLSPKHYGPELLPAGELGIVRWF